MDIKNQAKAISEDIIKWRRELHQIPEIGLNLPKTSAYVMDRLNDLGIEYKTLVDGSGIVAIIKGKHPGKTIVLRADMDALPIKEETNLPFASKNGNMHACGHDSHTAMLLGAAKILKNNEDKIKGNVKLIFQPAEEGPGGAKPMIEEGVLENPKVDAVLGLHIGNFPGVGSGKVMISYSNAMACLDKFYIKVKGRGAHGAYPETGVDPVAIASQVINALQTIRSREIKPTAPAVVTIGKINGGSAYNIIPDYVELEGTARAVAFEVREVLAKRIEEITANITKAMRGDYEYEYTFGYPPLVNSKEFTERFVSSAKKIVKEDDIVEFKEPFMGGEDMAYFLEKAPGTFFFLTSLKEENGIAYPAHNAKFQLDESIFYLGSALFVQTVFDFLNE